MSKSPEEIKSAVLKECERVCPKPETGAEIGKKMSIYRPSSDLWIIETERWTGQNDVICSVSVGIPEHDDNWELAYRILNIEAREFEERANGLVGALKNANLAIIDVLQHGDSSDKLRIAHKINSEALNQWKGGGNGI